MKRVIKVNKDTLNALLPPIPEDFERDMRSMIFAMPAETGKERKPMKKKISVGLVLAVVFTLLAASALAAVLLGGRDFVDQILAPKAAQNNSDMFTNAEVDEILRIAKENNLTLSDEDMYVLTHLEEHQQEGYYKEELMRRFVKTEYGFYPAAWPIEVQHWYEQLMKACGLDKSTRQVSVLPEGDEISQEKAVQIAEDFIHEKYDATVNLNDKDKYIRFMTYQEQQQGSRTWREWGISYEAQDLYGADYSLTLDTAGNIKNEYSVDGIWGTSYTARGMFMMDRFTRVYGDPYGRVNWNSAILLNFQDALKHRKDIEPNYDPQKAEQVILDHKYLLPDDTLISREQAIEAAIKACGDLDYETVYSTSQMAVCMEADGKPIWKVTLEVRESLPAYVELDAKTGKALRISYDPQATDTDYWRPYATEAYWEEYHRYNRRRDARFRAEPKDSFTLPAFWHSDTAPEGYWEWIDKTGFTGDNLYDLYIQWEDEYGWNTDFWPFEAQAIDVLLHDILPDTKLFDKFNLPGYPGENDLTEEEILPLAKAAFKTEFSDDLPGMDVSPLIGAYRFWFCTNGHREWEVILYRPDNSIAGYVWLDSETGDALEMEADGVAGVVNTEAYKEYNTPIATPPPQADGKPWFWGMDFAAPDYWEQFEATMKKYGVTPENIGEKEEEWDAEYGNEIFWPHDCKLLFHLLALLHPDDLEEDDDIPYSYIFFPDPAKKSQAEIEEIAWQALHDVGDQEVGADWLNQLRIGSGLFGPQVRHLDTVFDGPVWVIQFYDWDAQYKHWNTRAFVYITQDGNVLHAELDLYGNG